MMIPPGGYPPYAGRLMAAAAAIGLILGVFLGAHLDSAPAGSRHNLEIEKCPS